MNTKNILPFFLLIAVTSFYSCNSDEVITGRGSSSANVNGTVISECGYPIYPAIISFNYGYSMFVNPDGTFNATVSEFPYRLIVYRPGDSLFTFYVGLTSRNPKIYLLGSSCGQPQYQNLASIYLVFPRNPQNGVTYMRFISNEEKVISYQQYFTNDSSTTIYVKWKGPSAKIDGKVVLLRCLKEPNGGIVSSFTGFCVKDTFITAGETMFMKIKTSDLQYDPPESQVTLRLPGGFSYFSLNTEIAFGGYSKNFNLGFNDAYSPIPLTFKVPGSLKLPYKIHAHIFFRSIATNIVHSSDLYLSPLEIATVPDPSQFNLLYPANDTTGVDFNTDFVHNGTKGVYVTTFRKNGSGSAVVQVVSSSNAVRFPMVTYYGVTIPPNTEFTWSVTNYDNYRNLDEFVSDKRFENEPCNIFSTTTRSFRFK